MKKKTTCIHPIYFIDNHYDVLVDYINEKNYSKIFIVADGNTTHHCLPLFANNLPNIAYEVLTIPSGETHKNIDTCTNLWQQLSDRNADRKSLVINLGGGVVTDLGGFVALTFKRGIDYINIPTSLLAMVDAAIGGKTGVDLGGLKNQIGIIQNPMMVIIDTNYLNTLENSQKLSGLAEVIKHGLISSKQVWQRLKQEKNILYTDELNHIIQESVNIKCDIVSKDIYENNLRKRLNFGHTLGHAIETYFLNHKNKITLLHGEAIAIGMILAAQISYKQKKLSKEDLKDISQIISIYFEFINFSKEDIQSITKLLKYDKKNSHGNIYFVLLENIGEPIIDQQVSDSNITEAFDYYHSLSHSDK